MKTFRDFFCIVDHQTFIVAALAVASTWLCLWLRLEANIPSGLIGVAIVFPIVFSINAAYRRREEALKNFASIKAHAAALYYAHRDWPPQDSSNGMERVARARLLITQLFEAVRDYFQAGEAQNPAGMAQVYGIFSELSRSLEVLRAQGLPANEVSRANQYTRVIMIDFERMRNILHYRTPLSLRAYSRIFLNSFPVIFGPYFAHLAQSYYPLVGYGVAVLYSVVLVSLDNIQQDLEYPFDQVGTDDIQMDVAGQYRELLTGAEGDRVLDLTRKRGAV
jgi:predicted membrane chloride channel (bestrophin family)